MTCDIVIYKSDYVDKSRYFTYGLRVTNKIISGKHMIIKRPALWVKDLKWANYLDHVELKERLDVTIFGYEILININININVNIYLYIYL
jgi:hypothetical protein